MKNLFKFLSSSLIFILGFNLNVLAEKKTIQEMIIVNKQKHQIQYSDGITRFDIDMSLKSPDKNFSKRLLWFAPYSK